MPSDTDPMQRDVLPTYPHWIPALIASGAEPERIWTELSGWVEDQLPGVSCHFGLGEPGEAEAPDPQWQWIPLPTAAQPLGWMSLSPCDLTNPDPHRDQVLAWAQDLASIGLRQWDLSHRCQDLQMERDQFQIILDNAPMGIVIKDPNHCYVWVNRYKEQTTQQPQDQIIGKSEYDFFAPEVAATLQAHDQQVMSQGQAMQFEETTRISTGKVRHCLSIKFPLFSSVGQLVGLGGIFVDITDRKDQEDRLYLLQKAIEACGNGVVITDALNSDHPVIYVNPAFERMTGYTLAEVKGINCRHLQGSDRDQPEIRQIRAALRAGEECCVTLRNYRKDGTLFWNELYLSPVREPSGRITHYIGVQMDVSQRRHAEESLRVSEARLRTLIENIPFCVWARDTDLRLVIQNEANRRLYGNEIGSRPDQSNLSPYRVARWETLMRRALEEVVIQSESTEMIGGQPRYFHRITMTVPEATEGIKYMGIGIDITERKQVQIELDRFFRVSLDLLCIVDLEGGFHRVNPAWGRLLGYAQHELEGRCFLDLVHPEDQVSTLEAIEQLRQGTQIFNFVNRYRAQDGSYRYIEWRCSPYGHLIYAAARDVTERQLMEMALIKTEQDLRYRVQFESLLTQISADFIRLPPEQIETGIQRSLQQILDFLDLDRVYVGLLDGEKLQIDYCACYGLEAPTSCVNLDPALMERPEIRTWIEQRQSLWISRIEDLFPEGTEDRQLLQNTQTCSVALLPILRSTQVLGTLGLESSRQEREWPAHEVSLLTTFSQILANALERQRIERQRNEFIAIVSHELRTPLTSIRALLGLLTTGRLGTLLPRGQDLLSAAILDTDRLERLVNEILDLERLRSGSIQLHHQWCQVNHLMVQLVQGIEPLAEQSAVEIHTQTNVSQIYADPDRILQVLTNLVGNAIKFSSGPSLIQITVSQSTNEILWQVTDQGPGIPADQLETIFEPFVQVNSSDARPKPGTGLGLAICRQIIHHHQGRLWATSTATGTTFAFTLPDLPTLTSSLDRDTDEPQTDPCD